MRKILATALLAGAASVSSVASADVLGAGVSVGSWFSGFDGDFLIDDHAMDLEDTLGLERGAGIIADAHFEHPVPLIPNLRLAYADVSKKGDGRIEVHNFTADVGSRLDIEQADATLYYELLDNVVSVDAGLTIRALKASLELESKDVSGLADSVEVQGVLPMGYLAARGDLPFTGVGLGAELNIFSYGGDSIVDGSAYAQYDMSFLEWKLGYRHLSLDVEDGEDGIEATISGPFASIGLDF